MSRSPNKLDFKENMASAESNAAPDGNFQFASEKEHILGEIATVSNSHVHDLYDP